MNKRKSNGGTKQMNVVIIDRELNRERKYQIMIPVLNGFNHVYPGKLFTLEQAKQICNTNNYNIIAIGNTWQCLK